MFKGLGKLPSHFNRDLKISPEFPRGFSFHLQPKFPCGFPPTTTIPEDSLQNTQGLRLLCNHTSHFTIDIILLRPLISSIHSLQFTPQCKDLRRAWLLILLCSEEYKINLRQVDTDLNTKLCWPWSPHLIHHYTIILQQILETPYSDHVGVPYTRVPSLSSTMLKFVLCRPFYHTACSEYIVLTAV